MARWEVDVQMESGAVQGGVIGHAPTPAIFNTGQVLFGWAAAYRETGDWRFQKAAGRAADFLVEAINADGAWRRHGSRFARQGVNVYDARTAWGLLDASLLEPAVGPLPGEDELEMRSAASRWRASPVMSEASSSPQAVRAS